MEKIILAFIFLGGLRHITEQWKIVNIMLKKYSNIRKRGFHPVDYPICFCGECEKHSMEEKEQTQREHYVIVIKNMAKGTFNQLNYTVFVSGITLLSIYIFLKLTFNF